MIYLVTGGSGSGKSEYAEHLVMSSGCPVRYYVATMTVYGEEGKAKVLRHQELRRGKGFITVECPVNVDTALSGTWSLSPMRWRLTVSHTIRGRISTYA